VNVVAPLAVLVPFAAGCVLAALSPFVKRRAGWTAVAVGAAAFALTVAVAARGRGVVWFGGWTPHHGVAVGVAFAVDPLGAAFAMFTAALGVVALAIAARVIEVETPLFDALLLVFIGALIGFCLTGDLFNLFVFFELMSVSAYVLVGYEIGHRAALEGALTFAVANTVGSILLLFGIALMYGHTGALNLAQMGEALHGGGDTLVGVAFALIACGLLVKAAVVPFHLWTADAYSVAPTPVCILLAGAFSEIGLFGLARVYWTVFDGALGHDGVKAVLCVAGAVTALVGAVMGLVQHHLKRQLAFATIAQVGLFLVGIGLLNEDALAGVGVWVVADGLVKAGLFAAVAVVQHHFDSAEVADLHGRGQKPLGVVWVAGALTIASLPVTGSFLGKAMVEDAAPAWVPWLMLVVTGLTGGTLLRAGLRVFWGLGDPPPRDLAGDEPSHSEEDRERGGARPLAAGATILTLAGMAFGLVPGLGHAAVRAAAAFVDKPGYAAAVLHGRHLSVHVESHGPTAAAYLYALGSLALAVAVAVIGVTRPVTTPAPVDALRRLHSGRPGDYVAWTAAGAAVLAAAFALAAGG
jgi:multicomponent Na+:H+ antiporter subunit D